MVKIFLIAFCCFAITCPLCSEIIVPLFPETQIDNIVQDWWQNWTSAASDSTKVWNSKSSYYTSDLSRFASYRLNSYLQYQKRPIDLGVYEKRTADVSYNHFYYSVQPRNGLLDELLIGNYRLRYGKSLILGYSNRNPSQAVSIDQPGSPDRYALSGVAMKARLGRFTGVSFASVQNRNVSLKDSLITLIPKLKSSQGTTVSEQIMGASVSYQTAQQQVGMLYYKQIYDPAGEAAIRNPRTELTSGYYSLRNSIYRINIESAISHNEFYHSSSLQINAVGFATQLSAVYYPDLIALPYAVNPLLLAAPTNAYEYSYAVQYQPVKPLSMRLQVGLVKKINQISNPAWLGRSIISIDYKEPASTSSIILYRFDRDIIADSDSIFSETIPLHYRIRLQHKHAINRVLTYKILTSYHFEQKSDYDKNSYFWENSLSYHTKRVAWDLGISNWQTTNMLIVVDSEMSNSEEYQSLEKNDLVLFAHTRILFKRLKLSVGYKKSILGTSRETFSAEFSL